MLFVVVYGGTNRLAGHRGRLASWVLPVDRWVPFVPWTIVPYLSIDGLFVAAPFLCRDGRERRRLVGQQATAIVVAGAFFVALPLRFAFARRPGGRASFSPRFG